MLTAPVLFLIFNRPEQTLLSFERIREVRPNFLCIAADGPRSNKDGESEKCQQARAITENIDWPCTVKRLYRPENLGCGQAVSGAISWFFEHVEEGIILEDDCLADLSFFSFCSNLLNYYRNNPNIMEISGTNLIANESTYEYSYYFSQYGGIWGWATWRRAWEKYKLSMPDYPIYKNKLNLKSLGEKVFWRKKLHLCYEKKIDTWDFQWIYTKLKNNGLAIVPSQNLITNIGYGHDSTFTKQKTDFHQRPTSTMPPLVHPPNVTLDRGKDRKYISLFGIETDNRRFIISYLKQKLARFVK